MDILATLQNCVNAVSGIRPRIDQPEIYQTGQALINTLKDMIPEVRELMGRVEELEKKIKELQTEPAGAAQGGPDPEEGPDIYGEEEKK